MNAYNTLTDQQLTELLRQDDEGAFSFIYDRHWKSIYQACYNRLGDRELSKDIIQDIFTSLWNRRADIGIDNLSAYLHTAVKFQVLRVASRSTRTIFVPTFEQLITQPIDDNNPVEEREILHLLQLFIDALPEKRRIIFNMHYRENKTTAAIAAELGISQKTVLNQLNNAEIALRARLSQILTLSILTTFWLNQKS